MSTMLPALEHLPNPGETQSGVYFVQSTGFFQELAIIFRRHVILTSIILAVAVASIAAVLLIVEPRWRATALVMIQARTTSTIKVDPVLSKLPNDSDTVVSELEVLHSRDLILRLVDYLHLERDPEFNPNTSSGWRRLVQTTIGYLDRWLPASFIDLGNELTVRKPLEGDSLTNAVVEQTARHLDVAEVGRSRVIKVTFSSTNRELSSRAANALVELYVRGQSDIKQRASDQANSWITDNLARLGATAVEAAKRVADYKSEHGLIDGKDSSLIRQEMSDLDAQLTAAKVQRLSLAAKLDNITGKFGSTSNSLVLGSPIIQKLREQQATLASENAALDSTMGDKMPKVQANNAQIADVERRVATETAKIVSSLRSDFKTAQDHEGALQGQLDALKAQMARMQDAEVQLKQLENEEHADRVLYESFLQRSKETAADSFQPPDAVLMSHAAVPVQPYFPDKSMIVPGGLLGALAIAFMLILGIEARDRGFRNQGQVEKALGVPVVGIIPEFRREDHKVQGLPDPMSLMGSSMTDIFMRVCLYDRSKVVLIASAMPRESKTMTGLFLARISAMNGKRVLLIDADMRRSGLNERLPGGGPGLAHYLSGAATFEEIINQENPGVDYIACGQNVSNPAGLLISAQMKELLDTARRQYDLVFVDSPAIMAGPDAGVLAKLADETLMFVRWAHTPRQVTTVAFQRLMAADGVKVVGAVMTRIDLKRIGRYSMTDALSYSKAMRNYYPPMRRA